MDAQHEAHGHSAKHSTMGIGMKIMGAMMGLCVGGTVLGATAPVLGTPDASVLAILAGVVFAVISLRYHHLMGGLMGLCCGGGVLVAAAPGLGIAGALAVAIPVGAIIGLASHKFMGQTH